MIPFSNNNPMHIMNKKVDTYVKNSSIISQIPINLNSKYTATEIIKYIIPVHHWKSKINGVLNIRLYASPCKIATIKNIDTT